MGNVFKQKLFNTAKELRTNLPRSEVWFHEIYKNHKHNADLYNVVFKGFIPDVINHVFKYIIEIDGSSHDTPERQIKDKNRDKHFLSLGYVTYRIQAYNQGGFDKAMQLVVKRRSSGASSLKREKKLARRAKRQKRLTDNKQTKRANNVKVLEFRERRAKWRRPTTDGGIPVIKLSDLKKLTQPKG
jgi:very-short-patch-repair endonuclease